MAPRLLGYTDHARQQLQWRRITRRQVKELLATGERVAQGSGKFEIRGRLGRRQATVVVREDHERTLVITVWWNLSRAGRHREKEAKRRSKQK